MLGHVEQNGVCGSVAVFVLGYVVGFCRARGRQCGLSLCPNLHRAFDRHLFWIDGDYRVRVAEGFGELGGHDYGVQRFNGQQLRLPKVRAWWPRVENLAEQRA